MQFSHLDPDPDPATQINADPCRCGSGFATLVKSDGINIHLGNFELDLDLDPDSNPEFEFGFESGFESGSGLKTY